MKKLMIGLIALTSLLTINIDAAKARQPREINNPKYMLNIEQSDWWQSLTLREQDLAKAIAQVNESYLAQYQISISPSKENIREMAQLVGAKEGEIAFVARIMRTNYQQN